MESISASLKLVDVKKENLRKAFEALQAHSSSLSSFNLTWSDLESHFSSQISSLQSNLDLLQCQQNPQLQRPQSPVPGPARPELKSLCEKMDGLGLRNYIMERPSERTAIWAELQDALRCASDPAALVLVAVEGFHELSPTGNKLWERDLRWSCVMLLEELAALKPEIGVQVKEKAKKLSEEWSIITRVIVENTLACLGFVYLVAAYGLADGIDMPVLIDFASVAANDSKFEQALKLCRLLNLNVPDLISKLKMTSKKLLAVKLIFEFKLTDMFPPVPILKKHVELSKKLPVKAKKRKKGNLSVLHKNSTTKKVNSLKSVIKIIEEYKLESEYPKEEVLKHIEFLEKAAGMESSPQTPTSKPPQDPSGSKHLKNPDDKVMDSKRVIPPASKPQQQSKPQEPSVSKCLKSDQPGDTTVASERVTDESKQSAPVPAPKAQQQSMPQKLSGSKPPNAKQVGHKEVPLGTENQSWAAGLRPALPPPHAGSTPGPYNWGGPYPNIAPSIGPSAGMYGSSIGPFSTPGNQWPPGPRVYRPEPPQSISHFQVHHNGYGLPPQYHR